MPLFHVVLSFLRVYHELTMSEDSSARYLFTEADDVIAFCRDGHGVLIEATFDSVTLACSMPQLRDAVAGFAFRTVSEIGALHPSFLQNEFSGEALSKARELAT